MGIKSQHAGKLFEAQFEYACRSIGAYPIKIPPGCKTIGARILVRVKSPFDYTVAGKRTLFVDTKSCSQASFPADKITPHQIRDLSELSKRGHLAGYVVNFRAHSLFSFFDAKQLNESIRTRVGLKPSDTTATSHLLEELLASLLSPEQTHNLG